jgi:ABC-2 type transport system ATP-binding protein
MPIQKEADYLNKPSQENVIQCQKLTKRYRGDILAVDGIDLLIYRGEIFGLLGPNGAGKTTTVGMLTTLVIPTSGKAVVGGINVVDHPSLVKQIIGIVSQTNNLDRALTVWENLYYHGLYFGLTSKQSREATDSSLVQFRLAERAKADVMTISGGMAKRLQVARALLHRPSVLFLDEPTAGLDPQSRLVLWDILRKLRAGGQTILLTTHYMEEADQMCDRIAIMDRGHLLATNTPKNLKESIGAGAIVTINTTGNLNTLGAFLCGSIPGATKCQQIDGRIQLHLKEATGALPRIVIAAEKEGFKITDLSITEPTLETVFISLTGKDLRD